MVLSRREKILLVILFITLIFYVLYNYLYIPLYSKYVDALEEVGDKRLKILQISRDVKNMEDLKDRIEYLKLKSKELDLVLPGEIHQEETILLLRDIFKDCSIEVQSLTFYSDQDNKKRERYNSIEELLDNYERFIKGEGVNDLSNFEILNNDMATDKDEKHGGQNEPVIKYFTLNLNYKGDYKNLKRSLSLIEQRVQKIIVKNVTINGSGNEVLGNMTLELPYLNDGSVKDFQFEILYEYGKDNPFINDIGSYDRNFNNSTSYRTNEILPIYSDFYLILRPVSSSMATSTFAKSPRRSTAITSGNENVEEINLYIGKKNGDYIFRYENSIESYPKEKDAFDIFKPVGEEIVLTAYSQKRLNETDSSGVILNITNETDKELTVYINDDDRTYPRLTINKKAGKINYVYQ